MARSSMGPEVPDVDHAPRTIVFMPQSVFLALNTFKTKEYVHVRARPPACLAG